MESHTLFDFEGPHDALAWKAVDDVVMGGRSASRFYSPARGTAIFGGTVSLENNGGFASVRSQDDHYDLSAYDGISLRVRCGDGKRYGFSLRCAGLLRGGLRYEADFDAAPAGQWLRVTIPFSELKPRIFGSVLPVAPPLNRAEVTSFGFIIADKQAGPFQLEIDWIKAYRDA